MTLKITNLHVRKFPAAAAGIVLLLLLAGCSSLFPAEETTVEPPLVKPPQVTYDTYKVTQKSIENAGEGFGNVISSVQDDLFFKASGGRLKGIYVKLGDIVKKGDVIAELDNEDLKDQLRQAEINVKRAKIKYDKLKYSNAAQVDVELAQLDIEDAEITYDRVNRNLKASLLVSDRDGKVVFINQNLKGGDYVNTYTTLVSIDDGSLENLYVMVDNIRSYDFQQGMQIGLKARGTEFTGEIVGAPIEVPADADGNMRKTVFIKMKDPPDDIAKGVRVQYRIVFEKSDNAVVIPKISLKEASSGYYVYVLENGIKKEHYIETGIITATEVEVKKGISEGDLLIIE